MKSLLLCMFLWLTLALGIARGVPARPLYEPPDPPKTMDLRGTVWDSKEPLMDRMIFFGSDGTLRYGTGDPQMSNASWKQEGNVICFEINKGYRQFRGTVQADVIHGDSWNVAGMHWQTTLYRLPQKK